MTSDQHTGIVKERTQSLISVFFRYRYESGQVVQGYTNALHSHKAVSANPFGFVRADCFESPALLLVGDGAPQD